MLSINTVCDYIILMLTEAGENPTLLKLQKLLYYVQAWHLAFYDNKMFNGKFQAWVHGPVNRDIYDRFVSGDPHFSLYSSVRVTDILDKDCTNKLPTTKKQHIDNVLEVYARYTGSQLEEMSHKEEPWLKARTGYAANERCEVNIDEDLMKEFYKKRIKTK
jgi:uncharacterized phage-associated protein